MAPKSDEGHKSSGCFAKTKLCRFHILGLCRRGEECQFAHSPEEMCKPPDFTRTKLCKMLRETGTCNNKCCPFAHSADELRSLKAQTFTKTKMCHFYVMGHCSMGTKCNFAHSTIELREPRQDWPPNMPNHAIQFLSDALAPPPSAVPPVFGGPFGDSPLLGPQPMPSHMPFSSSPSFGPGFPTGSPTGGPGLPVALADVIDPQERTPAKQTIAKAKNKITPMDSAPGYEELSRDTADAKGFQFKGAGGGLEVNPCSFAKPVGLVPASGRSNTSNFASTATAEAPSTAPGLGNPMPMTMPVTDSPIYLFQADPRHPGSFQAVSPMNGMESPQSQVFIGQISDNHADHVAGSGAPRRALKGKKGKADGKTGKAPGSITSNLADFGKQGDGKEGKGRVMLPPDSQAEVDCSVTGNGEARRAGKEGAAVSNVDLQVKNTFLTFEPPAKPIRLVRTAEGSLCSLVSQFDDEDD